MSVRIFRIWFLGLSVVCAACSNSSSNNRRTSAASANANSNSSTSDIASIAAGKIASATPYSDGFTPVYAASNVGNQDASFTILGLHGGDLLSINLFELPQAGKAYQFSADVGVGGPANMASLGVNQTAQSVLNDADNAINQDSQLSAEMQAAAQTAAAQPSGSQPALPSPSLPKLPHMCGGTVTFTKAPAVSGDDFIMAVDLTANDGNSYKGTIDSAQLRAAQKGPGNVTVVSAMPSKATLTIDGSTNVAFKPNNIGIYRSDTLRMEGVQMYYLDPQNLLTTQSLAMNFWMQAGDLVPGKAYPVQPSVANVASSPAPSPTPGVDPGVAAAQGMENAVSQVSQLSQSPMLSGGLGVDVSGIGDLDEALVFKGSGGTVTFSAALTPGTTVTIKFDLEDRGNIIKGSVTGTVTAADGFLGSNGQVTPAGPAPGPSPTPGTSGN
jgi:hypothetical protein